MDSDPFQGIIDALNEPSITDWIGAVSTALTFLVALVAIIYASLQVREARRAREQTRELEQERSQPYVVVYTEPSEGGQQAIIDLVIKNFGVTAARDIRVSINPWPRRSVHRTEGDRVAFPEVIPILAPGQEWRTMWDSGLSRAKSDLPDEHRGSVSFTGLEGKTLEAPIVLDWRLYNTRRWVVVHGQHEIADALRDMRTQMGRWTEDLRGLKVWVRSGDAKDERDRQYWEERQAEIQAEGELPDAENASPPAEDDEPDEVARSVDSIGGQEIEIPLGRDRDLESPVVGVLDQTTEPDDVDHPPGEHNQRSNDDEEEEFLDLEGDHQERDQPDSEHQ